MKRSHIYLFLGCLGGIGPFVTDLYLVCLPEITKYFSSSVSMAQMSLTTCMVGLAVGQLIIGPLSDKYGRKLPLAVCLATFVLSSIACVCSKNIILFVLFRLLQGLSGAGGLVISKVYVTDMYSGNEAAKMFGILTSIQSIAPIVAPVLGGVLFSISSWQAIFILMAVWGAILLFATNRMKESLLIENRLTSSLWSSFLSFLPILRNRRFMAITAMQGFASIVIFSYISISPFLFQSYMGLSAVAYSICFAFNALGLVIGSMAVVKINKQKGLKISVWSLFLCCVLINCSLIFSFPILIFEIFMFSALFCIGIILPISTTEGLSIISTNKGAAAALLGTSAFILGGVVSPISGLGNMTHTISIIFLSSSIIVVWLYYLQKQKISS